MTTALALRRSATAMTSGESPPVTALASASDQKLVRPLGRRPAGHVALAGPLRKEVGAPPRTAAGKNAGLVTVVVADDERAGASGFLLKQCAPAELVNAVLAVAAGHAALAPRATRRLVDQFLGVDLECVHKARRMIDGLTS